MASPVSCTSHVFPSCLLCLDVPACEFVLFCIRLFQNVFNNIMNSERYDAATYYNAKSNNHPSYFIEHI